MMISTRRLFCNHARITNLPKRGFATKTKEGPEPQYANVVAGFQKFVSKEKFQCENGGHLPELTIAYETWGTLSPDKSNAILLHTGLSASSHAKSHHNNREPGWWEKFIGPGLGIDTNKFFVICTNILGGCYGTSGPSSVNPTTGKRYAMSFPLITVFDAIRAQFLLLDHLGIKTLHASVGSSLGGMQSLASAALFPDRVNRVISISAAARSHPLSIALRYLQRKVLTSDPNWNSGNYYDSAFPYMGMKLAREIATVSYRSGPEWETRFGRGRIEEESTPSITDPDFLIEQYLDYQGEKFSLQYDPNSLLYISKAMDLFDMGVKTETEKNNLSKGLARIKSPTLVIGVKSDILFPVWQQREIASLLKESGNKCVTYYELDALYGHDTFLIDIPNISMAVKGHLENSLTFMDTFE